MRNKAYILLAILPLAISNCSNEDIVSYQDKSERIRFTTNTVSTKAGISDRKIRATLQVWGYLNDESHKLHVGKSDKEGIKIDKETGDFINPDDQPYWPKRDVSINFWSYFPISKEYTTVNVEEGKPKITHDNYLGKNFILATADRVNKSEIPIELFYRNLTTQISFSARLSEQLAKEGYSIEIGEMKIVGIKQKGTFNIDENKWELAKKTKRYPIFEGKGKTIIIKDTHPINLQANNEELYMLPQKLTTPWVKGKAFEIGKNKDNETTSLIKQEYKDKSFIYIIGKIKKGNKVIFQSGNDDYKDEERQIANLKLMYIPFTADWEIGTHIKHEIVFGSPLNEEGNKIINDTKTTSYR